MATHSAQSTPTWAVVATVDEPAVLIAAFARHHLAIGASEVHLYLDRPHPELPPLIAGLDKCFVTLCDQDYWANSSDKKRPPHHLRRQKLNANAAFHATKCDWMLHCDADEFVGNANMLAKDLARLHDPTSAKHDCLKLYNRERVWMGEAASKTDANTWEPDSLFAGGFRFPTELYDDVLRDSFEPYGAYLTRGFSAHARGKSLARVGAPLDIGIHAAMHAGTHDNAPQKGSTAVLSHFDGLTPLHYILKMLKRAYETPDGPRVRRGQRRMDQAFFIKQNAGDADLLRGFVRSVKALTPQQSEHFSALMAFDAEPFEVQGCDDLDLSVAAFDDVLRDQNAAFFEMAGLACMGD